MTEILNTEQNISQTPAQTPPGANPVIPKSLIPQPVKDIFIKFYSNKRIFWIVTVSFGLILIIVIAGLIFGKKGITQPKPTPTPSQTQTKVQATPAEGALTQIQINLAKIKDQIMNLDVRQAPLQPPTIDYKISF